MREVFTLFPGATLRSGRAQRETPAAMAPPKIEDDDSDDEVPLAARVNVKKETSTPKGARGASSGRSGIGSNRPTLFKFDANGDITTGIASWRAARTRAGPHTARRSHHRSVRALHRARGRARAPGLWRSGVDSSSPTSR